MTTGAPQEHVVSRSQYGFFRTQVAPLPPGRTVLVYALLTLPAVAGAILNWSWIVQIVLMIPGLILSVRWGKEQARTDGAAPRNAKRDAWTGAALGGLMGILVGAFGGYDDNGRYLGLVVVAFGLVFDQIARLQYRRDRTAEG